MEKLAGKKALVIGACGGMGKAICTMLVNEKAEVHLADLSGEKANALASELSQYGKAIAYEVNAIEEDGVKAVLEAVGAIDVLINLAGVSIPARIEDMAVGDFDKTMEINVKSLFLASKYFMRTAQSGSQIIHIGSMAARRPNGNAPVYCAAKAAVNSFSAGLQIQAKEKGVRVTTLNPGGTNTAFWGDRPVPLEKMLSPQDIAEMVGFVLTRDARVAISSIDFESLLML